jgi:peptide/nickel transport system permease protein
MKMRGPEKSFARGWLLLWFIPAILLSLMTSFGLLPPWENHQLEHALGGAAFPWHPFGFDSFGRDLLWITLRASVLSSAFAASATLVALGIGLLGGSLIAVTPPGVRYGLERGLEMLLAFPSLLFALGWAAIHGPGWSTLWVALLLGTVPPLLRLVLVRAREILAEDYVLAARSLGASSSRIAFKHLAPAIASLCWVKAHGLFAGALLAEATLSFLGMGAPIGHDTWGSLLAQGKDYLIESPHLALVSGFPLILTLLSLHAIASKPERRL